MKRKGTKLITHVVLITLVAIILFPVVWVVMTSIRRDNAAFSPKLFSANITFQHYRDLLFPPRNVPVLIAELGNAISLSSPFTSNVEKAKTTIQGDLTLMKGYIRKTKRASDYVEKSLELVDRSLRGSIEEIKLSVSGKLRRIFESLKVKNPDPIAALYVQNAMGKSGGWVKYAAARRKFSTYEEGIGELLKNEKSLSMKVAEIGEKLDSLDGKLSDASMKVVETLGEIKPLEEDLERLNDVLKSMSEIPGEKLESTGDVESSIEDLLKKIQGFQDLSSLEDLLGSVLRNLSNVKISEDSQPVFESVKEQLKPVLGDLSAQVDEFLESYERLKSLENLKRSLEQNLKNLREKLKETRLKIEEFQKEHSDDIKNAYLFYLRWKTFGVLNFPDMVRSWKSEDLSDIAKIYGKKTFVNVKKCLIKMKRLKGEALELKRSKCSAEILKGIDDVMVLEKLADTIRKELTDLNKIGVNDEKFREILSEIDWADSYEKLKKASVELVAHLNELVKEFSEQVDSLSKKWKASLSISKTGMPVVPSEISRMNELVSTVYDAKVSGKLGISMRESRTLADEFPLRNYRSVFKKLDVDLYSLQQVWKKKPKHYFIRWVMNSVIVASLVAVITTAVTALAAYPFSRMRFFGRRYGIMSLLLIQMFPSIMYMVALYGMLAFLGKIIPWLGLDTLGGLTFVYLGNIAFNMFLIKGFYDTIPSSLEESAMIDGATRFQTFRRIVLPLARPILAVVLILTFMGTFNEYVLARIILQDVKKYTYALGLWQFTVGPFETEWGLFTAAALLGMTPMVILFLSMQRFLISGLTKGAVKG